MDTQKIKNYFSKMAQSGVGVVVLIGMVANPQAAAPGDLDTSFNTTGFVYTDIGTASGDKANAVAIQSDGKIVVGGSSNNGTDDDFAVVRYSSAGILDPNFNTDGKLTTPIGGSNDIANAVAVQTDGKIVVAGSTFNGLDNDFALARYTITGTLDTSFGALGTGVVTTTLSAGEDVINSLAIQSNGMIVAAGYASDDFAVARYTITGTLDVNSFGGGDGIVTTDFFGATDRAFSIAIQPDDGKLVVAGFTDSGESDEFAVVRYLTNGVLDNAFNGNGKVITDFLGNSVDQAYSVAIQPDGKILLAGFVNTGGAGGTDDFALARYSSSGILDSSFSSDGKVITPVGSNDDQAYSVAIQPTSKIVVAGFSDNSVPTHQDFSLARYTITGTLDTTFNTTGIVTTDLGTIDTINTSADQAYSAAVQSDNKIVVAGFSDHPAGNDNFAVVRFESPNSAPSVSNVTKIGPEDTELTFNENDFSNNFSDVDGDSLARIKITSLPANGTLKVSTVPVAVNQEIPTAKLGSLTFDPSENWNGATSFGWSGSDGLDYGVTGALVDITISESNDRPTISDIEDKTIMITKTTGPIPFVVGDVESSPGSLIVFGSSSDQNLAPNGNIVFGGSEANRTVEITPTLFQTGTATITIYISDSELLASDSFDLTVEGMTLSLPMILKITPIP